MSRYQPYPSYKDSGVEWLGEVPEHWNLFQLKRSVEDCTNGIWGNDPDEVNDLYVLRVADFNRDNFTVSTSKLTTRAILEKERTNRLLKKGDLLFEKSGGGDNQLVGTVVLFDLDIQAVTSNFVAKMTPASNFHSRYLTYAFAHLYSGRVNYSSIKQTTGIQNIDSEHYLSNFFGFPPFSEQTAIANFLDRETAKIDTLIAKQQRMIELLGEKRSAMISHAVTKGIDPNVAMKDSGVEWLGEVPEHWKIIQSRRIFAERKDRAQEGDEQLTASQKHGIVSQQEFMELEGRRVVPVITGSEILKRAKENDFIISMRSFQGGLEWCKRIGSMSSAYIALIPIKHVIPQFFAYLFKSKPYIQALQSTSNLVRDGQALRFENFSLVDLVIIPDEEQRAIADYLDNQTTKIDTLITKARQAIELMKERRTALISAAVTGKIDVRGMA
jgi:type I restriction enzyme S subunit